MRCLLALALVGCASAAAFQPIGFRDCKSQFKINEVTASDCILKEVEGGRKVCVFKTGSSPKLRINFTPDVDVPDMKTQVKAKVGETMLDFPLSDNNSCGYGLGCPLKAGQSYTFEQGITMSSSYPKKQKVQVKWVLDREDQPGADVCIIFLSEIED